MPQPCGDERGSGEAGSISITFDDINSMLLAEMLEDVCDRRYTNCNIVAFPASFAVLLVFLSYILSFFFFLICYSHGTSRVSFAARERQESARRNLPHVLFRSIDPRAKACSYLSPSCLELERN